MSDLRFALLLSTLLERARFASEALAESGRPGLAALLVDAVQAVEQAAERIAA